MLGGIVRRLGHLYPGEGRKALQLSLLTFLCSLATFAAFTLADGLFLEHVGSDSLPLTYFFTACGLGLFAVGSIWALNRFPVRLMFIGGTLVQCAFYGFFSLGLANKVELSTGFWMTMKIVADGLWIVMITGLWSFLDECYDLQDAKRLFGILNGAIILGAAAGGGLVALILHVAAPACLFGTVAMILLVAVWVTCWVARFAEHPNVEAELPSADSLLKGVFRSRYTILLLTFSILMIILELVAEFNYMSALQVILGGGVAKFLGAARAWTYVGALFFAVFIYGRSVRKAGVNNLLLTTPVAFLMLFFSWSLTGGLTMAIGGLVLVEGFDVAVTDTNFNLAINGVPARVRSKVRVLAQYFVEPVGMIIASALLACCPNKIIGLIIAGIMLGVALLMRRAYAKAIFQDLTESSICFGRPLTSWLTKEELQSLGVEPEETNQHSLEELLERLKIARHRRERRRIEERLVEAGASADLLSIAIDEQFELAVRATAGRALGRIDQLLLQKHLSTILEPELDRAFVYLYHSETLKHPLLCDGLRSSYRKILRFAVHLLGVAGGIEDCDLILRSLRSSNHKIHSQAIETLEKCSEKRLFGQLLPLIDDRPMLSKLRLYLKRGHTPYSPDELLDLLQGPEPSWQALAMEAS